MPAPLPTPSLYAWPTLLGAASLFFPALGAAVARRSLLREASGQVAGVLLLVGIGGLLGFGQALGVIPRAVPISAINNSIPPVLILAPLLRWIGGNAHRWRHRIQAIAAGALAVAAFAVGVGREFRLVTGPVVGIALTAICVVALTRSVRGADAASPDRRIVLVGLLTYYLTSTVSRPLIETLLGSDPRAVVDAHMGLQIVYAGCMAIIAWGVSRRLAPAPVRPAGPEPSRAPAPALAPPVVAPPDAYPEPKRPAAQRQAI